MKKFLAIWCALAIGISTMPTFAAASAIPETVDGFIDELNIGVSEGGSTENFLNPEDSEYVSQREEITVGPLVYEDRSSTMGTNLFRNGGGWFQSPAYVGYRVNPGWQLVVEAFHGHEDPDFYVTVKGSADKLDESWMELETQVITSGTVSNGKGFNAYRKYYYVTIPSDVYYIRIYLPELIDGDTPYTSWAFGLMSVRMNQLEFRDDLDTPEGYGNNNFLNSEAEGYVSQRVDYGVNTVEMDNSPSRPNVGTSYQRRSGPDNYEAFLTYSAAGGMLAEIEYIAAAGLVAGGLEPISIYASADGNWPSEPLQSARVSLGTLDGYNYYKDYVILPDDTHFMKVAFPDGNLYSNKWEIAIMTIEVRYSGFYDALDTDCNEGAGADYTAANFTNSSKPGYIFQRAGADTILEYENLGGTIGGVYHHRYGWDANSGYLSYKVYPGYRFIVDSYSGRTDSEISIYVSPDNSTWTKLTAEKTLGTPLEHSNGGADFKNEIYSSIIPAGMFFAKAEVPPCVSGDHWTLGIRSVSSEKAPIPEYTCENPNDTADFDDNLTVIESVTKNSGEKEMVTIYLASYNSDGRLTGVDAAAEELSEGETFQCELIVPISSLHKLYIWKGDMSPIAVYAVDE